jgi:hypothetical protein
VYLKKQFFLGEWLQPLRHLLGDRQERKKAAGNHEQDGTHACANIVLTEKVLLTSQSAAVLPRQERLFRNPMVLEYASVEKSVPEGTSDKPE